MPPVSGAFSPLDEELELGPEAFDPWLVESIVLLGTVAPFERVPLLMDRLLRVPVSVETARRLTERIGRTEEQREDAEAARVRATLPMPETGPAVQQLSLDGAMVPLVGGTWAEVKTLALGEVARATATDGREQIRTTALSYVSRLADADTFRELARGELYRRGTAAATVVCAVQDGADWQQRFVDHHRPDAVRILDFPHALEHLGTAGRAVFGAGTAAFSEWLGLQAHTFKHGDPEAVLAALRTLDLEAAVDPEAATHQAEALAYFEKRRAQITYADFRQRGYPIGSGAVESANKLVVEARLKGSGMHWDRASVNPMVSLRGVLCSDRWTSEWPAIWRAHLAASRRRPRRTVATGSDASATPPPPAAPPACPDDPPQLGLPPAAPATPPRAVDNRPTAAHPWRKPFFRSRQRNPLPATS
ncbi:MAG: ISKra4 family transposase [Chloroflexi bacterium]|nr:ISKra4 family transposase [Chloroflexota bacterium]